MKKKMKRIIGVMLGLSMALSMTAIAASASGWTVLCDGNEVTETIDIADWGSVGAAYYMEMEVGQSCVLEVLHGDEEGWTFSAITEYASIYGVQDAEEDYYGWVTWYEDESIELNQSLVSIDGNTVTANEAGFTMVYIQYDLVGGNPIPAMVVINIKDSEGDTDTNSDTDTDTETPTSEKTGAAADFVLALLAAAACSTIVIYCGKKKAEA